MKESLLHLHQLLMPFGGLTTEEWAYLTNRLQKVIYHKNERIVKSQGDIYFVHSGIIMEQEEQETNRIVKSNQLIFIPITRNYAQLYTLTFCQLLLLDRKDLYHILARYPHTLVLYDQLLQKSSEEDADRLHLLKRDKKSRITIFKANHRDVLPYMARKDIASYLCISEEYLRKNF
ncbi:hypothetical protein KO02_22240 [Sphingobacterium sp. ML3W]|uniref:Crp/Fnr family transcriptional regulator n=1 Tax=Sphingobacterium sp. ML3W TaxID=1538644 RepID=UPI0004F8F098|nr:cyclic nucleotide-binding domain-containing protein [Sphingobacterium sp. ML3W]AIM39099.1 hypothetical protein KO02_22240 [Sphingobacterium sp. ML3W]